MLVHCRSMRQFRAAESSGITEMMKAINAPQTPIIAANCVRCFTLPWLSFRARSFSIVVQHSISPLVDLTLENQRTPTLLAFRTALQEARAAAASGSSGACAIFLSVSLGV